MGCSAAIARCASEGLPLLPLPMPLPALLYADEGGLVVAVLKPALQGHGAKFSRQGSSVLSGDFNDAVAPGTSEGRAVGERPKLRPSAATEA